MKNHCQNHLLSGYHNIVKLVIITPLALLLFIVGGPSRATAQDAGEYSVLVLTSEDMEPGTASIISRGIKSLIVGAQLANIPNLPKLADVQLKNDGLLLNEGEQRLVSAHKFYIRGLSFLNTSEYKRAIEEFERALYFYRQGFPYAENDELYVDILYYMSVAFAQSDGERDGQQRYCEYVGTIVDQLGRSDKLAYLENSLSCDWSIENVDARSLTVFSEPAGSMVYLNGHFSGVTPATLSDLRRGEHMVTFVREGYRRANRTIRAGSRFENTAELELGLTLRPGVYRYIYDELQEVVNNTESLEEEGLRLLSQTIAALESEHLLLVSIDTTQFNPIINTLLYSGPQIPIQRRQIPLGFEPEDIFNAAGQVVEAHFGIQAADIPKVEKKPSLYFKFAGPPIAKTDQED